MRKGYRKIVANGVEFEYLVGKSNVNIRSSDDSWKLTAPFTDVTGMTWYEIERAQWKGYFSITPKMIIDLLEKEVPHGN